jgi:hypothetical protein
MISERSVPAIESVTIIPTTQQRVLVAPSWVAGVELPGTGSEPPDACHDYPTWFFR